jgi:competence protein ComEC
MGFMTNLFFVPWVGFLIVPLAISASVLSFFSSPLAALLIHLAGAITSILLRTVAFFASFPWASVFISTPTLLEIIVFYLLLYLTVHLRNGKRARILFAGLCAVLIIDVAYWNLRGHFQKNLTVTFIDVGQGDSMLIEFPGGKTMLIDGGGLYEDRFDVGKNVVAPFLWRRKIRRIDTLVLTHPDPDHLKGLNFIASHFSIGQFWESGLRADTEHYFKLEKTLFENHVRRVSLNDEDRIPEIKGVRISILNPSRLPAGDRLRSLANNCSLVLHLQFKNVGILLPGDIEKESEYGILRRGHSVRANVLKIPHHGSLSSSTPVFLEKVMPDYAILTVSERNIGRLPNPEVMRRYGQLGVPLFRTDRDGAVTVTTDGTRVEVRPFIENGEISGAVAP